MEFNIDEWYSEVRQGSVPVSYLGQVSREVIANLLFQIETMGEKHELSKNLKKRIYHISLELLQNIYHHADNPYAQLNSGDSAFVILETDRIYEIVIGNFVKKAQVRPLVDRLKQLNSLSAEERRILYKLILNNQEFSAKGGGSLGFIDISRKIKGSFDYETFKFNEDYFFFRISIVVS